MCDEIKNIDIRCDREKIKIKWEWGSPDRESIKRVDIFFKKSDNSTAIGQRFCSTVLRMDNDRFSNKTRPINAEKGFYTFTFEVENADHEKHIYEKEALIGKVMTVAWTINHRNREITFPDFQERETIPGGALVIEASGSGGAKIKFPIEFEINKDTKIAVETEIDNERLKLEFKHPYDTIYNLVKR